MRPLGGSASAEIVTSPSGSSIASSTAWSPIVCSAITGLATVIETALAPEKPPSIVKVTSDAATAPLCTSTGRANESLAAGWPSAQPPNAAMHPSKNRRFTAHLQLNVG